ncbi:MAG: CBS domain-containing protein [Campylobacterota bacterium]|nr:CBS domain-containing protein [Campylobacterota bacterium]
MFSMYDDDGLNFRSNIDHLYSVHSLSSSHRLHNETKDKENTPQFKDSLYKGKIDQEAKDKYKQMANLDTRTEIFHVEQVMSYTSIIINDSTTIQEAYDLMQEHKVQQLLVRSDNKNHLKGMITQLEILNFMMVNSDSKNTIINKHISEISTKNIITTDPISDIRRVSKVMIDFNLNAIPVVDSEDVILGVVSRHDIVKAVSSIPHLQIWA